MDATRLNQMVLQKSEDLDLTHLFPSDDVNESVSNSRPSNYTPFSIRDILRLDQPNDVQRFSTVTRESRVRIPPFFAISEANDSSDDCPNREKTSNERRQAYSSYQVRELENVFTTTSYPGRKTIEQLAQLTDLTPKQVRIWFQNRRQKYKTVARSGGRSWILRSTPRVLRSNHPSHPEPRDLLVRSNQYVNDQSQPAATNQFHKHRIGREAPVWSPVLTSKVPAARHVQKFHPYITYRSVPPLSRETQTERCFSIAALMRQQKMFCR